MQKVDLKILVPRHQSLNRKGYEMLHRKLLVSLIALITLKSLLAATTCAQEAKPKVTKQQLKPTKAVVNRPSEWFYAEAHAGPVLEWTISKEDTTGGKSYQTGIKIQSIYGLKQATQKTPKQFVEDTIKQRKETEGVAVQQATDEVAIGPCRMLRLLTEEDDYIILHEYYYGTGDIDAVVVITRGAPKDEWPKAQEKLFKVGSFNLQAMVMFQSKKTPVESVPKDDLTEPLTKLGYKSVEMTRDPSGMSVVSIRVNESKPLRFVCDTGANTTIISPSTAKKLKLVMLATNSTAAGLGGAKKSMTAPIRKLQFGDISTEWQTLEVTDISQLNKQFAKSGTKPVNGFLGSDWMKKHQAVVDISRNRLFFKIE